MTRRKKRLVKKVRRTPIKETFVAPTPERMLQGPLVKGRGNTYRNECATEIDRWYELGYFGYGSEGADRYEAAVLLLDAASRASMSNVPGSNYEPRVQGTELDYETYEMELVRKILKSCSKASQNVLTRLCVEPTTKLNIGREDALFVLNELADSVEEHSKRAK